MGDQASKSRCPVKTVGDLERRRGVVWCADDRRVALASSGRRQRTSVRRRKRGWRAASGDQAEFGPSTSSSPTSTPPALTAAAVSSSALVRRPSRQGGFHHAGRSRSVTSPGIPRSLRPQPIDVFISRRGADEVVELAKERLLNGSHCTLGQLGTLAGHLTTAKVMNDPLFAAFIDRIADEIIPWLADTDGLDLARYEVTIVERLNNPHMADQLARLCRRGSTKVAAYLLPSFLEAVERSKPRRLLTLTVAGWLRTCTASTTAADQSTSRTHWWRVSSARATMRHRSQHAATGTRSARMASCRPERRGRPDCSVAITSQRNP
jgi:hypothetical protein